MKTFSSEALSLRLMLISVLGSTNTPKDTFNKYVNDTLKTVRSLATGGGNRELAAFRIDSVESSIRRNRTEIADALYDNNEDSEINARHDSSPPMAKTMTAYDTIRHAIKNKHSIECVYRDSYRILSPHTLGTKNGIRKVLSVQTGGYSSSGLSPHPEDNWRCMFLDDVVNTKPHSDSWTTASNHSSRQTCIDDVHCASDY